MENLTDALMWHRSEISLLIKYMVRFVTKAREKIQANQSMWGKDGSCVPKLEPSTFQA